MHTFQTQESFEAFKFPFYPNIIYPIDIKKNIAKNKKNREKILKALIIPNMIY